MALPRLFQQLRWGNTSKVLYRQWESPWAMSQGLILHNCVLHNASISSFKALLIFSLCMSISTLTVCLKCTSFVRHNQCLTDASSRLNCSATEELTSILRVGQMLRLVSFCSRRFWFFWWNLSYREYLSLVPVIGCLPDILSLSCSSGNGDLRFLTHSISTLSSFLAASLILPVVGAHSLPSCGWKNNCFVRLLVWRATCQKCNRWESAWNLVARLCGLLLTPSKRESWHSTQHHVHRWRIPPEEKGGKKTWKTTLMLLEGNNKTGNSLTKVWLTTSFL